MIYLVLYICIEYVLLGFFNYRGGSVGVGGGGLNFIIYFFIIGIVIMLMGFMVCLIFCYCCGKD